jgi:hypothetical protein
LGRAPRERLRDSDRGTDQKQQQADEALPHGLSSAHGEFLPTIR